MTGQHSFLDANRAKRFLQDQIGFIGMSNDNMWINLVAVIMKEVFFNFLEFEFSFYQNFTLNWLKYLSEF